MNQPRRILIFSVFLGAILTLGMIFWPFVLEEILMPTALTAWFFMRIFILSVDQKFYWGVLILVGVVAFSRHLIHFFLFDDMDPQPKNEVVLTDIDFWRSYFTLYGRDLNEQFMVKRELIRLLVSLYATKQGVTANFLVTDALKNGEIPLPGGVHSFLFDEELTQGRRSIKKIIKDIWFAPRHWIDERTGRKTAEYYRMVAEVLNFIETSLEMKKDDERIKPNSD